MPKIKPVSELRNYPEVLKSVSVGSPVYLTRNGTGRYVLMDISDFGYLSVSSDLAAKLGQGKRSGENLGWITQEAMEARYMERMNA